MAKIDIRTCGDPLIMEAYHTSPMTIKEAFARQNEQVYPVLEGEGHRVADVSWWYYADEIGAQPSEAEQQAHAAFQRLLDSDQVESFAEIRARAGLHAMLAGAMRTMIQRNEGGA